MNINNEIDPALIKKADKSVKIMALGGLGEVGKNCYVIEFNERIYVVDYGVLFPKKEQLGIDYVLPNYLYLQQNEKRIVGLFITHGHEDHIGGVPFLLKKVKIKKIYAPLTAKLMIERKLKEHKLHADIIEINADSEIKFPDVTIHAFRQTHSIPDALGFFFQTPAGNVVTTGDFKVDFSPPGQKRADFHKMTKLSEKGVLCLLSDSTNAPTPGFSLSELTVGRNLKTLIKEAPGRILFTTFASNINRVQQIIEGAIENNRKVCLLGRSLVNALDIGTKTKYLQIKPKDLVEAKNLKNYPAHEICIICTGSQGEELAALSRIASNLNQYIQLGEEDTVIFASNPIPGNNYQIGKVIDRLHHSGCKIIKNSDVFKTHASGHASQEEQKLLISLFNPTFFAPIHGTYNMQLAHKRTAIQLGIPEDHNLLLNNGDLLEFASGEPKIYRENVPGNSLFVSGSNINIATNKPSMDKLASDGIMIFIATYDTHAHRRLITFPQITTRGFIIINESLELIKSLQQEFSKIYNANKKLSVPDLEDLLSEKMSEMIYLKTKKYPLVTTTLVEFDHNSFNGFKEKNENLANKTNKKVETKPQGKKPGPKQEKQPELKQEKK